MLIVVKTCLELLKGENWGRNQKLLDGYTIICYLPAFIKAWWSWKDKVVAHQLHSIRRRWASNVRRYSLQQHHITETIKQAAHKKHYVHSSRVLAGIASKLQKTDGTALLRKLKLDIKAQLKFQPPITQGFSCPLDSLQLKSGQKCVWSRAVFEVRLKVTLVWLPRKRLQGALLSTPEAPTPMQALHRNLAISV